MVAIACRTDAAIARDSPTDNARPHGQDWCQHEHYDPEQDRKHHATCGACLRTALGGTGFRPVSRATISPLESP